METVNCLRCDFRHKDNGNCTAVGGFCTAVAAAHCPMLRKYLDTGLTPAQCESAKAIIKPSFSDDPSKAERIRELLKADKGGHIAVLSCKDWLDVVFGDQVLFWGIDKDYMENPIREISVDDAERIGWYDGYETVYLKGTDENGEAWEFYPEDIGQTVFLTYEEAKKALEEMKDD